MAGFEEHRFIRKNEGGTPLFYTHSCSSNHSISILTSAPYCLSLRSISAENGIAGIPPLFSTHKLAAAFPNRPKLVKSSLFNSSSRLFDFISRAKTLPKNASPAPVESS